MSPMNFRTTIVLGVASSLLAGCAADTVRHLPPAAELPFEAAMPDPLFMMDGRRITTREQWFGERKPELKALFQHYMYGEVPPTPAHLKTRVLEEHRDFLGGQATLRLVTIETGSTNPHAPRIDLLLVVPNARVAPA